MAINLIDTVMENLQGPVLEQLGAWLGETPDRARAATASVIPVILAGVADKTAEADGAALLGTLLDQVDDGLLDQLGSVFKSGGAAQLAESASGVMDALFGSESLTTVLEGLALAIGLGSEQTKSLLGLLTPVALGALKRLMTRKGLSLTWLAGLFAKQQASIAGLLPHGWSEVLAAAATVAAALSELEEPAPEAQEA